MICFQCGTAGQLATELGRGLDFTIEQKNLIGSLLDGTGGLEVIPADIWAIADVYYLIHGKDSKADLLRSHVVPILHHMCSGGERGCDCQHGAAPS